MFTSIFIAKILGLYTLVIALALLINRKGMLAVVDDFVKMPGLLGITGIAATFWGCFLIVVHNTWVFGWPVVITVIAYLSLIKGIVRLCAPQVSLKVIGKMKSAGFYYTMSLISLALGIYLTYYGFFGGIANRAWFIFW